jgi:Ser/Thr protein kinase RdoA (MazF antagonist)
MRPYETLTARGQVRRLHELAHAMLGHYHLGAVRLSFVQRKVNAIFRVCAPDGCFYALRIHPPQADPEAIAGELHWLMAMRRTTDLLVPEPVPAAHRALLVTLAVPSVLEPHHGVLLRWLPGRLRSPEYVSRRQLEHVGATIAALHAHAARYVPAAPLHRQRWDADRMVGRSATLAETMLAHEWLGAGDRDLLTALAVKIRVALDALCSDAAVWGLIHADLHPWNMVWQRGRVGVFDFDDCGAGHYLFDLAVALANWSDGGAPTGRYQAILTGYAQARPLLPRDERLLPTLMQGRACRSIIGWLQRTPPGIAPSVHILGLLAQLRRLAGVNGG